ncbi:MAG: hypothetical protein HY842_06135 [Bacteroidetes bacterium]|nr:hypothetical protein [Bacteroidota bacterium]
MPNPYDSLFGNNPPQAFGSDLPPVPEPDAHLENQPETLDEILKKTALFQQKAQAFSTLLSQTRAVDHEVPNELLAMFIDFGENHAQGSLAGEKACHELLTKKFRRIIEPMRELAALHLDTVQQFNNDIDDSYFSVEKEDGEVKSEKADVVDSIHLQRKILADAAGDLEILEKALEACERRMKKYVDAGGVNNLSTSELSLLVSNRERLTDGSEHQFNYTFFDINLLDKAAISLGVYLKETTAQYLQKLMHTFENRSQ